MSFRVLNPYKLSALCILLIVLAALSGCHQTSNETVIGMLAPLTGSGASFGIGQRDGVSLALDEINAAGGINGMKIKMVVEDTRTEPPTAVTAAIKLLNKDRVVAIIGSAASLDVPAYMDQLEQAHVPQVLPVAVLPKITESGAKWTFRSAMNDKIAARKMAEFIASRLKPTAVALLLENSAFGATGEVCGQRLTDLGYAPLMIERFNRGDIDFSAQLTKMRAAKITHIQFWGYYADYAQIARQLKQMKYDAQLMGNQAPVTQKTLDLGGEALEGALNVCLFVPGSSNPRIQKFVKTYEAKYNSLPDTWAAQSYDGMYILARALEIGGSNPEKIREALAGMKDFEGITGTITFNSQGDAEFRGSSIVVVRNQRFVPFEEALATHRTE